MFPGAWACCGPCYDPAVVARGIEPIRGLRGRFRLGGDKSISHRAAIFGALASGTTRIAHYSPAADCSSTLECLAALGNDVQKTESEIVVEGGPWRDPAAALDAGNSGSTLRMLLGAIAGRRVLATLTGDASLRNRPVERVAVPLRLMGARIESTAGRPPVAVAGGDLSGIEYDAPIASAQVKTAVLLAGLQASGSTVFREPALSRDHTERLLPVFGATVERRGLAVRVDGRQTLRGTRIAVPGDPSSAAFLLVAATILPGSEARIDGVALNPLRIAFVSVLQRMGAAIAVEPASEAGAEPVGTLVARSSRLGAVVVDAREVPALIDEIPILAVAAAFAEGQTVFSGIEELRVKESDRVAAIVEGLRALGVEADADRDSLSVRGGATLRGARLRSHGDHRIAMALSVAALASASPSVLDDASCVAVSFPDFYDVIGRAAR